MDKVKGFAAESNMRFVNAAKASKSFKKRMEKTDNAPLNKQDFIEFMIDLMK